MDYQLHSYYYWLVIPGVVVVGLVLVVDFVVPCLSSNVPLPMHGIRWVFHFHAFNNVQTFYIFIICFAYN